MGNNEQKEVPTVFELLVQSLRGGSGMKNKCGGKKVVVNLVKVVSNLENNKNGGMTTAPIYTNNKNLINN